MKKLFLALCIGALSTTSSLIAQVADSTVVDTSSKVAPSRGAPMVPDLPKEAEQPSRGIPIEQEAKEEKEESGSLKLLREERLKREILEGNLEEAIAYPLNLETENLSSFQVLDSIADHNRFIFTGEDHRVEKFNTTLETKMMQYLNTKGYQYYLMEAGWVSAYMVNRYILSGDSAAEQILSTYYSHNFFEMFKGLKLTNDSLAPDKKITAVGLDIERDAHDNIRLAEVNFGEILKYKVQERLRDFGIKATIVAKNIGYELRCADPIPFDMEYTRDLGYSAAQFILNGGSGAMVSIQNGHFVPMYFQDILDPKTKRTRVRLVDPASESFFIARRYMLRLNRADFDDPHELAKYAATCGISLEEFRNQFFYLMENDLLYKHIGNGKIELASNDSNEAYKPARKESKKKNKENIDDEIVN